MPIITEIRRKLPILKNRPCPDATDVPTDMTVSEATPQAAVVEIPVADIIPNRAQPRTTFNQNAIVRLADSIRRYGILQPLTVRKVLLPAESRRNGGSAALYELVAGERRLRAAKLAEFETVPCIIINTDDATSAELAIIENLLRENLNMFEQAEAFQRLIREFHLTQDEAARRVSMSQSAVANKLRILRLLPEERQKILEAGLTERHARALLKLNDPVLRGDILQHVLDRKLNVSATEAYIDNILTEIERYKSRSAATETTKATAQMPCKQPSAAVLPESNPSQNENLPDFEPVEREDELPSVIRAVMSNRKTRFKGCLKDLQPFYNSIQNAIGILESAGIAGSVSKDETEDEIRVVITLTRTASSANEPN